MKQMFKFLDRLFMTLRLRQIKRWLSPDLVVLDAGSGEDARTSKAVAPYVKEVIAIDKRVQNRREGNILFIKNDFDNEKIPSVKVDLVMSLAVLEHLNFPEKHLNDLHSVLKPEGTILITVPTVPNKYLGEFLAYKLHLIDENEYRDHKRYYTKKMLSESLKSSGFQNISMSYFNLGMDLFVKATRSI